MRLIDADELEAELLTRYYQLQHDASDGKYGHRTREVSWTDRYVLPIIENSIATSPTIEVEPVRRGRWEAIDWANEYFKCSGCGRIERWSPNYCPRCGLKMAKRTRYVGTSNIIEEPNCGAKMDGGEE